MKENKKEEILRLNSEGLSFRQIAKLLNVAKSTVSWHVNPNTRTYYRDRMKTIRSRLKLKLIELGGGKCCICNYDRCKDALHFHHLNPKDKLFSVGKIIHDKGVSSATEEKCIEEIKKCILVCANCHAELHEKMVAGDGVEPSFVG